MITVDMMKRFNVSEAFVKEWCNLERELIMPNNNNLPSWTKFKKYLATQTLPSKQLEINNNTFTHFPLIPQLKMMAQRPSFGDQLMWPLPVRTDGAMGDIWDTPQFKQLRLQTGVYLNGQQISESENTSEHKHTSLSLRFPAR